MALILKTSESYKAFGQEFPDAYMVCDAPRLDKHRKVVDIPFKKFTTKEARMADEKPLETGQVICQGDDYDDYFADYELNTYAQCYKYLMAATMKKTEIVIEDKKEVEKEVDVLILDKWESDE